MPRPSALWTLLAGNALTMVGVGFFLPILPLYIGSRGGSSLLVGAVFAAGTLARGLVQYPAGWAADHLGRRPVIVGSMLLYAAGFLLYLAPMPLPGLVAVRFVHAAVAGAYFPAAAALLADLSSPSERGRAFGRLRASDMAGLVLGPGIGGLVAAVRLDLVFPAGAAVCVLAALMLALLPAGRPATPAEVERPQHPLVLARALLPLIVLGAGVGFAIGCYDAIWALNLARFGAGPPVVGLSFVLFALPIVGLGSYAGGLADRFGHWRTAALSTLAMGGFAAVYGILTSIPWLVGLGMLEGILVVAGQPALSALVSRSAPPGQQGQTQGIYQSGGVAAQVLGALAGGALFSAAPPLAFFGITAMCLLAVAAGRLLAPAPARAAARP